MMCNVDPSENKQRYKPSSRIVARSREIAAKNKSELYRLKCWVHNGNGIKKHIFKIELDSYKSKGWIPGSGRTVSTETREKLRQHNLSKPKPGPDFSAKMSKIVKERFIKNPEQWETSAETRDKLSKISVDRWKDPERAKKMASKSRSTIECPYCGKIGSAVVMPRWHFDNCKQKP